MKKKRIPNYIITERIKDIKNPEKEKIKKSKNILIKAFNERSE